jgi:hypothetical protein
MRTPASAEVKSFPDPTEKLPTELVYRIIKHAGVIPHQGECLDSTTMDRAEQLIPARSALRLVSHVSRDRH